MSEKYLSYACGAFLPTEDVSIPVEGDSLGTIRGLRVFTSAMCFTNTMFHMDDHIDRLLEAASFIGLKAPFDKKGIIQVVLETIEKNRNLGIAKPFSLKLILTGGNEEESVSSLYVIASEKRFIEPRLYTEGAKVITYPFQRHFPEVKLTNYVGGAMAMNQVGRAKKADYPVFCTPEEPHFILEGDTFNVFFIKDDVVYTPKLGRILKGITRKVTCEIIKECGYKLIETDIKKEDLASFNEAFITSSVRQIMPIKQIDDILFSSANETSLTNKFKEKLDVYTKEYK